MISALRIGAAPTWIQAESMPDWYEKENIVATKRIIQTKQSRPRGGSERRL
jgi:hypothetical protein